MSDVDSNGVDWLDRFRAYSERFKQSSVAGEVYLDTLEHIKRVRKERDEARREICMIMGGKGGRSSYISPDAVDYANSRGWDCFNENTDN